MSDIGLYGVVALFIALGTIALGLGGVLVFGLVGAVMRLPVDDERSRRVGRFVAGPLACAAMGLGFTILCVSLTGYGEVLDEDSLGCPVAGLALWITVAVVLHRRRGAC